MNSATFDSPRPEPERRRLLQLAAASATTLWLPRSAWSQSRLTDQPFALGVASGSPTADGMVLWTRLMNLVQSDSPVTVRWEIAHDEAFTRIVQQGQAQALPELAHSVHVEVQGLASDRWYFYRFMVGSGANAAVSPLGRTRTFPKPDAPANKLRLAYASCQRWEHGYYSAWRHMRDEDLDAVLFLGDYIYEYGGTHDDAVRHVPGGTSVTLEDYRARHALHKSEPELQAMHAACPWLVTWDDHEVQNDYAGLTPGTGTPAPGLNFPARRAAAYQAFYEHMPLRSSVLIRALAGLKDGAEMRIYGSVPFGRLATLHLLDDRQYRDVQACSGKPGSSSVIPSDCKIWNDPQRTLLGTTQEQWLDAAFARAGKRESGWNIVGQQTLFGKLDTLSGPGERLWNDGWTGYPAAQQRFTDAVQQHQVSNLVLLGGDIHQNWVGHVKADYNNPKSASLGVEFCGTSITSRGSTSLPKHLSENPHFVFAEAHKRGYGVAEFTPDKVSTTLRAVDDVSQRDSGISTLARFEVQAGRAVVERA